MNKLLLCTALCSAFGLAGLVTAQDVRAEMYVNGKAGLASVTDSNLLGGEADLKKGYGLSGAVGTTWEDLRVELELGYQRSRYDSISFGGPSTNLDGHASALSTMANAWYDVDTSWGVTPYVGGGLGMARVKSQIDTLGVTPVNLESRDTAFAYQAGAGVGFNAGPNLTLSAGYRYMGAANVDLYGADAEYRSHNVEAGARLKF